MAQLIGSVTGGYNAVTKEYPVADGVTVTSGQFCFLTAGRVTSAAVEGDTLLGMVIGGQSNNLANTVASAPTTAVGNTAGTVKVLVAVGPDNKYVIDNDNTSLTFAASHVGYFFDLAASLDQAQVIDTDTASTSTGQLECIQFGYNGDDTLGVYIINEHKYKKV
jgi:hypothetical protein